MKPDLALDVRETSHMSAGMLAYARALRRLLPVVAPDLRILHVGGGDNFDLAEQIGLPLALLRARPRLVHFPTIFVPRFVAVPAVVTVHDVIDLEFPQYVKRKVGPYWRAVVAPVLRAARAVITDDARTAELLAHYARVAPTRVRIIPLGVDAPEPLPAPLRRARPYFFYAGNHRPHKDLPTLVRAWASLPPAYAVDLILTGPENAGLRAAGGRESRGELIFAGDVSDADVWALHRGAAAYVHPALREGFGLPLLEALRAGTLTIAAGDAIPDVLKPAVRAFPARDAPALTALLAHALDRTPQQIDADARAARDASAHLTWERTVRATAALYRELLA
ncbi:MAG TPA: glycosyltransferase [Candidatus Baltobacteraceae bacterium]|nr:glycosyltransferase [Candidatus Baltobacteraceae bacterium]